MCYKPISVGEKQFFFFWFDVIFWSNERFSGQGDRGGDLNFYPYNRPYADFPLFHLYHEDCKVKTVPNRFVGDISYEKTYQYLNHRPFVDFRVFHP